MKQLMSSAVQTPPGRRAATEAPEAPAGLVNVAPNWNAALVQRRGGRGAACTQPAVARRPPRVAPSLRLRVSEANRSLLRWLRAAELAAWEDAEGSALHALKDFQN